MNPRWLFRSFYILAGLLIVPALAFAQAVPEKNKIICDHAAPPRGMHYVCKSQCDCHPEGKLKNDEDGISQPAAQAPPSDLKITTLSRTEMGVPANSGPGHVFKSEDTLYMKGARTRRDNRAQLPDGGVNEQGFIDLCDTHTAIEVDPQRHEYRLVELGDDGLAKGWQKRMRSEKEPKPTRGGTVEVVTENIDTGETKTILGHLAHHWITKQKKIPGPGACTSADESETDGWYIAYDAPAATCSGRYLEKKYPPASKSHAVGYVVQSGCSDHFSFTGEQMRHGMPLLLKHVSHLKGRAQNGKETEYVRTSGMEVTELSTAPIDTKIFEVPAGYRKVARLRTNPPPRGMSEQLDLWWEELKIALGR